MAIRLEAAPSLFQKAANTPAALGRPIAEKNPGSSQGKINPINLDSLDPPPQIETGKMIQQAAKKHCPSCNDAMGFSTNKAQTELMKSLNSLTKQTQAEITPNKIQERIAPDNQRNRLATQVREPQPTSASKNVAIGEARNQQINARGAPQTNQPTVSKTTAAQASSAFDSGQRLSVSTANSSLPRQKINSSELPRNQTNHTEQRNLAPSERGIHFTNFSQIQQFRASVSGNLFISSSSPLNPTPEVLGKNGNTLGAQNTPQLNAKNGLASPAQTNRNVGPPTNPRSNLLVNPASAPKVPVPSIAFAASLTQAAGLAAVKAPNGVLTSKGIQAMPRSDAALAHSAANNKVTNAQIKKQAPLLQMINKKIMAPLQNLVAAMQTLMSQIFGTPSKLISSILARFGELLSALFSKLKRSKKIKKKNNLEGEPDLPESENQATNLAPI